MSKDYKLKYELSRMGAIEIMREQMHDYRIGDKKRKGEILNLLESVLHRPRKSIIRTMNILLEKQSNKKKRSNKNPHTYSQANNRTLPNKPGRPKKYSAEANAALCYIWEAYNYPCAERLHPEITEAMRIFIRDREWKFSKKATRELESMSLGSMRRRLVQLAKKEGLVRGFSHFQG